MEINKTKEFSCTDLILEDIELLKKYRDIMWSNQGKASFFAYQYLQELPDLMEQRLELKDYVSDESFEQFEKEYQMTICLLEKCLIKAKNKGEMPSGDEDKQIIENILEKIAEAKDDINYEEIIEALRKEDVTTRKALESLGLSEEQIKKVLEKGIKVVDSVLDVEPEKALR